MTMIETVGPTRWGRGDGPSHRGVTRWAVVAAGAVAGGLLFLIARDALPDDSYITFSYAQNLAENGEWALSTGIPANTATSPLNVWLLALGTLLTGTPVIAAALLLCVSLAATAWWLYAIAAECRLSPVPVSLLGVGLLVTSPLMASTVGLETYLGIGLLLGLTRHALFGRWSVAGVLAGLVVLARPDLVTAAVVVTVVGALYRRAAVRPAGALVLGAAVAAPWHLFLWLRFGSATSDTLPAKSVAGGWGDYSMVNGLGHYLDRWTLATSLSLLPAAIGALALAAVVLRVAVRRRLPPAAAAAAAVGLAGVVDYAALSALGVVPFYWYYAPLLAGLSLCGLIVAAELLRGRPGVGLVAVGMVAVTVGLSGGYDLLRGAPWDGMTPIRINWATPAEYREIARDLPIGSVVESPGEIGTLAYFCDCTVVDYLGDPGRMEPYVEQYRARRPESVLLALNYLNYDPPAPVAADFRLVYEFAPPTGVDDWPVNFPADVTKRMRLERLPVPSG